MPPDQYRFQKPTQDFQSARQTLKRNTGQAGQQGGAPPSVAVYTPIWLPLFALIFSTFIGMLSGFYPALRAATMIPVLALKYE
jgi:ABC-type lipoprotein release transport system permease subunit